ncbi:ROK family protein [Zafaria sp. Z1313]|uniref:ROK family protein n=1 Tax=unclassified Zafaria TaxID=2828765 RepID=UPI002E76244B|nr:ROK family protein [Zafaria sp. J156]MEE1620032.1 ROK family protein [Zafaria sp. J156]
MTTTPRPHPAARHLLFDVGGTDIKSALADADGRLIDVARTPTPRDASDPGGAVVEALARLTAERGTGGLRSAGVVLCGIVDEAAGTGVYSANLGWRDFPFRYRLGAALGLPVGLGDDVGAAAEAELALGVGRDGAGAAPADAAIARRYSEAAGTPVGGARDVIERAAASPRRATR